MKRELGVRIMLGIIVGMLGIGMLVYLIPGQGMVGDSTLDVVAQVDGAPITIAEVRTQLNRVAGTTAIPPALMSIYAQQVLGQMVFEKELQLEAKNLGIQVSDQERADRIRLLIPTAFVGDSFIGTEQYVAMIQSRAPGMGVTEFENAVNQTLLEEKFVMLVTDGITVTPSEIEQEFRRRNEKIKVNYVVVKPDDLEARIAASDADLAAYYETNKARYTVPERRIVRYAMLNFAELRARVSVPEEELLKTYNARLDQYKVADRAHVAHILFKTVGKTDAETEETRKKAEDVLKRAKGGADFAALAKQYSEDTTKDQGGDLNWIVRGQTVPEFEKVAFSQAKNTVSDLVKTQYGFHIIKVLDRELARTQTLDEVRASILQDLQQEKSQQMAEETSTRIAEEIRRAGRPSIDDLGKKFNLTVEDAQPLEAGQPILQVGNAPEIPETIFRLRSGDVSAPILTDLGYVVLSIKEIQPSHPGTLPEVRDRVLTDYRHDKAVTLAKSRAEELSKRAKAGEDFANLAKSLGLTATTSDLVARTGNLTDVGTASQLTGAFSLAANQASDPVFLGANWVVYRVVGQEKPNPDDLEKQRKDITDQVTMQKRQAAYDAFRKALEARMLQDGKLRYNEENVKRLSTAT